MGYLGGLGRTGVCHKPTSDVLKQFYPISCKYTNIFSFEGSISRLIAYLPEQSSAIVNVIFAFKTFAFDAINYTQDAPSIVTFGDDNIDIICRSAENSTY